VGLYICGGSRFFFGKRQATAGILRLNARKTMSGKTQKIHWPILAILLSLCVITTLSGCASTRTSHPDDPYESFNRSMFAFNETMDKAVLRPVATGYDTVMPRFARTGVSNFFGNLGDVWSGFNNLLQGKAEAGMSDWMRFAFNSTFGIFGLLDIASEAGLNKHDEDFGQTLAAWGAGEGPYLVLPFLGPRTTRDALALPADWVGNSVRYVEPSGTRNALIGVKAINTRARALGAGKMLEEGTFDTYGFVRDFYLGKRRYQVSDGKVSLEYEDYDAADRDE